MSTVICSCFSQESGHVFDPADSNLIYRVFTGHTPEGKTVVAMQGPLPKVQEIAAGSGTEFHDFWSTCGAPTPVDNGIYPPSAS